VVRPRRSIQGLVVGSASDSSHGFLPHFWAPGFSARSPLSKELRRNLRNNVKLSEKIR
jgi:hypothetical protein